MLKVSYQVLNMTLYNNFLVTQMICKGSHKLAFEIMYPTHFSTKIFIS